MPSSRSSRSRSPTCRVSPAGRSATTSSCPSAKGVRFDFSLRRPRPRRAPGALLPLPLRRATPTSSASWPPRRLRGRRGHLRGHRREPPLRGLGDPGCPDERPSGHRDHRRHRRGLRFGALPPCADPRFDHRSCDYWEDEVARLQGGPAHPGGSPLPRSPAPASRPAAATIPSHRRPRPSAFNPFAPRTGAPADPWAVLAGEGDEDLGGPGVNPFAPAPKAGRSRTPMRPRKLRLLARGLAVFGSYAKVLLLDGEPGGIRPVRPAVGVSTGAAHPRPLPPPAQRPSAGRHHLHRHDRDGARSRARPDARGRRRRRPGRPRLRGRRGLPRPDAGPGRGLGRAPDFWRGCGFAMAVDDERYPVMRLELT